MRERVVLERLVEWARTEPAVRALILTSSRARADETVDVLSDYDVIVAVTDADDFAARGGFVDAYPMPVARWGDEDTLYGARTRFFGVVYADGTKIDWTVWPEALLHLVAQREELPEVLDVGYRVLVDVDGSTASWKPPTLRAHVPKRPTSREYRELVEEFWWSSTYVAKSLWRDELTLAKYALDVDMKLNVVRRFLEWRVELEHDWSLRPGKLGRDLKRRLPPSLWHEFAQTYVGSGLDENWDALFRTTSLFGRIAKDVGDALGYEYPQHVDDTVTAHLHAVRDLPG